MITRKLYEATPPAAPLGQQDAHPIVVGAWERNGTRYLSVGHGHYTAGQALELAATIITAANVASGYSEDGEEAML